MTSNIYVLGTGLSHNGSAVLLKNGEVCVGIEKERLSRVKHDGGNDNLAIQYCLDAEGITLEDIDLVVQSANFEIPDRKYYQGERILSKHPELEVINISHHLAHAYSAIGTSPFKESVVMVIDGCGSPLDQFLSLHPEQKPLVCSSILEESQMQCEKDSFYYFDGQNLKTIWKDFSIMSSPNQKSNISLPTTLHSIGGFYNAISLYVFGDMNDLGKLMGLAPFGKSGIFKMEAFEFKNDNLYLQEDWKELLTQPSKSYQYFSDHFEYYANVAKWAQEQIEKAVMTCLKTRLNHFPHKNLCYTGGVALNAVANTKLVKENLAQNIYFEPAAGDNGLALGCAFYGWLAHLKKPKKKHNESTCFGKSYNGFRIKNAIKKHSNKSWSKTEFNNEDELLNYVAQKINTGKIVGWFHGGSEFGPRALGRRSILAHPGKKGLKELINKNIKFREDFRPFAPSVLKERVADYFEMGLSSPYMILVDKTKAAYRQTLFNVTHEDGSSRVQTVDSSWNPRYAKLIQEFEKHSGIPILLNTSLNRKGTPMVETPEDAINLFEETAIDILILENMSLEKQEDNTKTLIINFIESKGIDVIETNLDGYQCFLPGLFLKGNSILMDSSKMIYPGDLLHEAGHIAVTEEALRPFIGSEKMPAEWPSDGDEIASILWSYAAIEHLQINAEIVFHKDGYKGDSEWLIQQFRSKNFMGLPLFSWMGFCDESKPETAFPNMIKWQR
ncbi:carbamoyltransferase C-terminal domain-containing protein [uncultured Arcticibacterium sp.]|uniref:carbamoyltransferase family protein n=1 Tax=uncultured Arcticibacterium sp. TaxID=2173042 RepID=UPI0030FCC02A